MNQGHSDFIAQAQNLCTYLLASLGPKGSVDIQRARSSDQVFLVSNQADSAWSTGHSLALPTPRRLVNTEFNWLQKFSHLITNVSLLSPASQHQENPGCNYVWGRGIAGRGIAESQDEQEQLMKGWLGPSPQCC